MPKHKPNIVELQKMAQEHAERTMMNVVFPIGHEFGSKAYMNCLKTIMQSLIEAWAEGYAEGTRR